MADAHTVSVLLRLRDEATAGIRRMEGRMDNFATGLKRHQQTFRQTGLALTAMAAGGALALAGTIRVFAQFEQALANAGAVSGATADQMQEMSNVARELGRTTVFTAKEAAGALSFLAMAGFQVEEATKALPGVLQLAAAAQIDLAEAADITSNVLSGYGFQVEQLGRVNDVLVKSFTSANTNLRQLGEAMKFAAPVASAAGVRFEETAAALALMGNAGIQASMAGTAVRGAISRMLAPSAEAVDIMNRLGLSFTDSAGNLRPLIDIIRQLERSGVTAGESLTLFGLRAGPGMLALVSQGSDALAKLTTELENSGGTAAEIAARQLDTLGGQLTLLKSALEGVAIEIGKALDPTIRSLANVFAGIAERIANLNPTLIKVAVIVASVGVAFAAIAGPTLLFLSLLPSLTAGFLLLGPAITIATGPIGIIIVAIAALTAGALLLWRNWNTIWPAMKQVTETAVNFMIDVINKFIRVMTFQLVSAMKAVRAVLGALPAIGDEIKAGLSKAIDFIENGVIPKISLAAEKTRDWGNEMDAVGDGIKVKAGEVADGLAVIPPVLDSIGTGVKEFGRQASESINQARHSIVEMVQDAISLRDNMLQNEQAFDTKIRTLWDARTSDFLSGLGQRADALAAFNKAQETITKNEAERNRVIISSLDQATNRILFNLSDQGRAWKDLGGTAQGVLDALTAMTGRSASSIISHFAAMTQKGETWKDLLLRLDTEGTINLGHLAERMRELAEAANAAARASAAILPGANDRFLQRQRSNLENQILTNMAAGVDTSGLAAALNQIDALQFRAHGGPLRAGQSAIVGERGPELFVPSSPGTILPTGASVRGGATYITNITINGTVLDGQRALGQALRAMKDGGSDLFS